MIKRLTDKDEILRISKSDSEYISSFGKEFRWGSVQDIKIDSMLNNKLGIPGYKGKKSFFEFAKSIPTLGEIDENIKKADLEERVRMYALYRATNIRSSWLDESYIGTLDGVELNPKEPDDWDFRLKGIEFDLKSSPFPVSEDFSWCKNGSSISNNPEKFVRDMFLYSSPGDRANPYTHKQSNRFFMVYKSAIDKDYSWKKRPNTIRLKFVLTDKKRSLFEKIFQEFNEDNILHYNNMWYQWDNPKTGEREDHFYKDVYCAICLIGEDDNGELKYKLLKKSN